MKVICYSLGQLQANCYFLIQDKKCLIIDPADDAGFILEELQRKNLRLVGMLATHGHFDHVMAVGEIQLSINTPLYISKEDDFLIYQYINTAEHFLGYRPVTVKPISVNHLTGEKICILNFKFRILHTPGHTPGSACFYFKNDSVIFTGDTIFKNAIGRHDHVYSSKFDLKKSLRKILLLPSNTVVYPGHGEQTSIGQEQNALQLIVV